MQFWSGSAPDSGAANGALTGGSAARTGESKGWVGSAVFSAKARRRSLPVSGQGVGPRNRVLRKWPPRLNFVTREDIREKRFARPFAVGSNDEAFRGEQETGAKAKPRRNFVGQVQGRLVAATRVPP